MEILVVEDEAGIELSRLNRDPRSEVPVSPLLRRVVAAALTAGLRSGGLVDATLVDEIEAAGYATSRDFGPAREDGASPPLRTAGPSPRAGWCEFAVDERAGTVTRPPGMRLDPGGIAKGLLAALVGELESHARDELGLPEDRQVFAHRPGRPRLNPDRGDLEGAFDPHDRGADPDRAAAPSFAADQ